MLKKRRKKRRMGMWDRKRRGKTEVTKGNRQGPVHPEAPERGLCVGKEGWGVINLAGPGCPGSTLGLFRWPSPSASSCCRHCLPLSVLKKPHRKRNVSVGRERSTSRFYGFLVSAGALTDGVTRPQKRDLRADVWKTKRVTALNFAVNLWSCV